MENKRVPLEGRSWRHCRGRENDHKRRDCKQVEKNNAEMMLLKVPMEAEQIERQHKECERQERDRQDAHEICQERDLNQGQKVKQKDVVVGNVSPVLSPNVSPVAHKIRNLQGQQ